MLPRRRFHSRCKTGLRLLSLLLTGSTTTWAESHTWQGANMGEWSTPSNWSTGLVPDATGDTVSFTNSAAAGTDLTVGLAGSPFSIGAITVANTVATNSVILGSAATETDTLTLDQPGDAIPVITVPSGTLKMHALLTGDQGWIKAGNGTLSFRDNPQAQTFAGTVQLNAGMLLVGADTDLGAADNDLVIGGLGATIYADPPAPLSPVVLGASRAISIPGASIFGLGNTSDSGTLEIAGPISGQGIVAFNGIGTLTLSGAKTYSSNNSYALLTGGIAQSNITRTSELRFVGPTSLRASGNTVLFDFGYATMTDNTIRAKVDLGAHPRACGLGFQNTGLPSASANTSVTLEIVNGTMTGNLSTAFSASNQLDISMPGGGMSTHVHLPESAVLTGSSLTIGGLASASSSAVNSSRLRIGTNARLNLSSLSIGINSATGRLDALAPGSTLTLRGHSNNRMGVISMGYAFSGGSAPSHDASIDLSDGFVDILTDNIYIGYGLATSPSTTLLKFGGGTLDATNLFIGGRALSNSPIDCGVVQGGGDALIPTLAFGNGNSTGNVSFRYRLGGGSLAVENVTAPGNITGAITRRIEWSAGLLRNYPARSTLIHSTSNVPLEIALSGLDPKTLVVETARTFSFGAGTRLISSSPDVVLVKSGAGTLQLDGITDQFNGTLQHGAGILALGSASTTHTVHAGALVWHTGTLACDLSTTDTASDLLALTGTLTHPAASSASARVIDLKNCLGSGTYTLATYAASDLTPADFVVTGVRPDYTAEFSVGPTALTVTLAPDTAFTIWRRARFATSANTGPAADLADPDADGRPNLLEYALGTEPLAADADAPATISLPPAPGSSLQLSFQRIADPALTYTVRAANDPAGPWDELVFTSTGSDNTTGPVTVQDSVPLADQPRRFLRLFVTRD